MTVGKKNKLCTQIQQLHGGAAKWRATQILMDLSFFHSFLFYPLSVSLLSFCQTWESANPWLFPLLSTLSFWGYSKFACFCVPAFNVEHCSHDFSFVYVSPWPGPARIHIFLECMHCWVSGVCASKGSLQTALPRFQLLPINQNSMRKMSDVLVDRTKRWSDWVSVFDEAGLIKVI